MKTKINYYILGAVCVLISLVCFLGVNFAIQYTSSLALNGSTNASLKILYSAPPPESYVPPQPSSGGFRYELIPMFVEHLLPSNVIEATEEVPAIGQCTRSDRLHRILRALSPSFDDIQNHWSKNYVEKLRILGIVSGYDNTNTFGPDNGLTRAEFTKMVLLVFCYPIDEIVDTNPFYDVDKNQWYSRYIQTAKKHGIVHGYLEQGDPFKPNGIIQRDEALKIFFEASKHDLSAPPHPYPDTDVTKWYHKYINFGTEHNIVNGYEDGLFRPSAPMRRGEAAKVLVRYMMFIQQKRIDNNLQ